MTTEVLVWCSQTSAERLRGYGDIRILSFIPEEFN